MLKVEWKGKRLDEITSDMIDRFKAKREACRSTRTVIKEMQVIRRLFTKAAARGKIQANPAAGVKAPKAPPKRKAWLPTEKYAELMGAFPNGSALWQRSCGRPGARRSEALNLKWADCDMKAGTVMSGRRERGRPAAYLNATRPRSARIAARSDQRDHARLPAPATKPRRLEGNLTREQEQERIRAAMK